MKKLAIIGTVGLPAAYGGFETLVDQLVVNLNEAFEITVYCSGKFYPKKTRLRTYKGAKLIYLPLNANGIQSIPYDICSIIHAVFKADLLLILGVSGCILLPFFKFFTKKRFFVNIDGIEWKRDKWGAMIKRFLRYSEIQAIETAEGVITDNKVIQQYVAATYGYESYLIEYGGDHAFHVPIKEEDIRQYPFLQSEYLFGVCRIEPENNIHIILKAVSRQTKYPFAMVGNWDKSQYGKDLKSKYSAIDHLYLIDPVYEPTALNRLRSNCFLYLHGHCAGGTNPSLVEAMNLGVPIVAFDVGYNRATTEDSALFFKDVIDLELVLSNMNETWAKSVGDKMKAIADKRYTWKVIGKKYLRMLRAGAKQQSEASIPVSKPLHN